MHLLKGTFINNYTCMDKESKLNRSAILILNLKKFYLIEYYIYNFNLDNHSSFNPCMN